jgi:hypothetical protein
MKGSDFLREVQVGMHPAPAAEGGFSDKSGCRRFPEMTGFFGRIGGS